MTTGHAGRMNRASPATLTAPTTILVRTANMTRRRIVLEFRGDKSAFVRRLEEQQRKLRQELAELGPNDPTQPHIARTRARLAAKLRAVENIELTYLQLGLFR